MYMELIPGPGTNIDIWNLAHRVLASPRRRLRSALTGPTRKARKVRCDWTVCTTRGNIWTVPSSFDSSRGQFLLALCCAGPLWLGCSSEPSGSGGSAGSGSQAGVGSLAGAGGAAAGSGSLAGAAGSTPTGGSSAGTAPGGGSGGAAGSGIGGSGGTTPGGGGSGGASGGSSSGSSCKPDYLLCEDFEGTDVGKVPTGWTAHGMASVAEDQARGGKHSLKISPADNGERRIYHPTPMVGAQHWGRVHYRVQLPVPDAFVHSTLVTFYGKGPTVGDAEFRFVDTVKDQKTGGFAGGKHQFLYNVQPNGAEFGTGSNYDYTFEDKWHCAEWHVDAATQSYTFYFDDKQVIDFMKGAGNYKDSELPTTFAEVRLGWNNYQSAPPGFTAWLDDFAVDDARVGCAAP